jgi:hypothetical protein
MFSVWTRRPPVNVCRCDRCGSPLACYEGEPYCPECVSYAPAPEPAPAWFTASTNGAHYIHEGPDLEALLEWCRGLLEPDGSGGDIVLSAGERVYAVLTADGRTVRVRP